MALEMSLPSIFCSFQCDTQRCSLGDTFKNFTLYLWLSKNINFTTKEEIIRSKLIERFPEVKCQQGWSFKIDVRRKEKIHTQFICKMKVQCRYVTLPNNATDAQVGWRVRE